MRSFIKKSKIILLACVLFCMAGNHLQVQASDIKKKEQESSKLQKELEQINQDILDLGLEIANNEEELELLNGQVEMKTEQLAIAKHLENEQYQSMKLRIKYMYENGNDSMISILLEADGMTDFLNRVEFVRNINNYDRDKLEELNESRKIIAQEERELIKEQNSQQELGEKLEEEKAQLKEQAKATAVDVNTLNLEIEKLKKEEEERKAKEEAERKAKEEAERKAKEEAEKKKQNEESTKSDSSSSSGSGSSYEMPSGSGVLTKQKGVNYYKGHRETYYSQRVLPGGGLKIPGRHVAKDGTIRDADNYICVASSDYPKGTVVETSLGPGKVYDSGCAKGTIDLYTDW